MLIETIVIGTSVIAVILGIIYYLGYLEDKKQREYLQEQVKELLEPEDHDSHLDEPIDARRTVTEPHDRTCTSDVPKGAKAGPVG